MPFNEYLKHIKYPGSADTWEDGSNLEKNMWTKTNNFYYICCLIRITEQCLKKKLEVLVKHQILPLFMLQTRALNWA